MPLLNLARSAAIALLLSAATVPLSAQTAGDYGSWVTGAWNTVATWRVYDGVSWASSPAASAVPNANTRVWIRTGTTVTAAFGSTYHCAELFIEATGRLYNNNTGATNLSYVHVYGVAPAHTGQIVVNGNLGNGATLDGISLSIDGASITMSGSGTANAARIRKTATTHPISGASLTTTSFTIDMNVNLRFSAGSTTMLYNGCSAASNFHVTINAGRTLALVGAAGTGNVSIDGLAGTDFWQLGGSITVNGTLLIPGILYATTNNTNAAYECRITIGPGGFVRTTQVHAAGSGTAWHRFFVNAGGILEISGTPVAWTSYFVNNNQYVFDANSQTTYSGAGTQNVPNVVGGYGNLRIRGTGVKTILGTLLVKGNLEILNVTGTPELDVTISNFQVTVYGNWTSYGTAGFNERTGLVLFSGSAGTQVINTAGGEDFFNWRIAKSAAQPLVRMDSDVRVAQVLNLNTTAAILDLNGNMLTLLNPAVGAIASNSTFGTTRHIRSERTDNMSRVRWNIGTTTGAHVVPFGTATSYIPFTFDLLSGDAGSVTMATYGTPPDNMPLPATPTLVSALPSGYGLLPDNAEATVDRFWQIDVTGTPNTLLTFRYQASELPSAPLADPLSLRAQRYNSAVPYWEDQLESVGNGSYFATANNVSAFGPFTLTHILSPLPVELLRFDARVDLASVRLDWTTASELNNDRFEVLRSRDGIVYEALTSVPGAGNSNSPRSYTAYDRAPWMGLSYYKLRQHDSDGQWQDSHAVPVHFGTEAAEPMVYPNPVRDIAYLQGLPSGTVDLRITDATGRLVSQARKSGDSDRFDWPLGQLPAGSYLVQVIERERAWTLRLLRD
ncbi:MAG: T9SS type A sorting domain-containing protein [Flavobacteriales bacterium]|nr:T9SS type A sorting domain-containing protein [Flavobacteriales bacterium]